MKYSGKIYLVGAGPGDPDLLTIKAHRLLQRADLILHDDLVPPGILSVAAAHATIINVGKRCGAKTITQDEINARMIEGSKKGSTVIRLKSGDPGIFGRLAEEIHALSSAGVPHEIVPGITAGIAAAASLGVSLTDRTKSARVVIVTGHKAYGAQESPGVDWKSLAREDATLLIYMPGHEFERLRDQLLDAGLSPDMPAVVVSRATMQDQQHRFSTLGNIGNLPPTDSPSILLIGRPLEGAGGNVRTAELSQAIDAHLVELSLTSE